MKMIFVAQCIGVRVRGKIIRAGSAGIPTNVYGIHELIRDKQYLDKLYTEKAGKYKDLKEALVKDMQDYIRPLRERREKIVKDRKEVLKILERGGEQAKKKADEMLELVKKNIGVTL